MTELHQTLLGLGYRYQDYKQLPADTAFLKSTNAKGFYVKTFDISDSKFTIALDISEDPHTVLPSAYILRIPDKYNGSLLPHINYGWYLCYVDQMEADWDPNDLFNTYLSVDTQIQETLSKSLQTNISNQDLELEGELASYWLPQNNVYLVSELTELGSSSLQCKIVQKGSKKSWCVYHQADEADFLRWVQLCDYEDISSITFSSSYLEISPNNLSGQTWPPESFKSFLTWLSEIDNVSRVRLIQYFSLHHNKRHLIFLNITGYGLIAFYIEIDSQKVGSKTYSNNHNKKGKKGRKLKQHNLASVLCSKGAALNFTRLNVISLSKSAVLSRNRPRPQVGDLRDKNIALIGCGTIGSYLAPLLLRSGAGCGNGCFHLFDPGNFEPENFGRHHLGSADFGVNKATAMAKNLLDSIHYKTTVQGFDKRFPINESCLSRYDIILDATGRPPLSKRLARVVRYLPDTKRPIIIHGFNDGFGRASKVFVDNQNACYGCLVTDSSFYRNGVDLRFYNLERAQEQRVQCGATYTPHDAAVSVVTASIMQEAALNSLEEKLPWTYKEHLFDLNRSRKPCTTKTNLECEVCNV